MRIVLIALLLTGCIDSSNIEFDRTMQAHIDVANEVCTVNKGVESVNGHVKYKTPSVPTASSVGVTCNNGATFNLRLKGYR